MILEPIIEWLLRNVVQALGLRPLHIGGLAMVLVAVYHASHISGWLVHAGRWLRMAALLGTVFVALVFAGLLTGALSLDSGELAALFRLLPGGGSH